MMYFKLIDSRMQTYNGFQWEVGKWYRIEDTLRNADADLCTCAWFHCYDDKLLAILLDHIHAHIYIPYLGTKSFLFRVNVRGLKQTDFGLKFGFTMMRLVEEVEIPQISNLQRCAFAILCAKEVFSEEGWIKWANDWLNGRDRDWKAARSMFWGRFSNATTSTPRDFIAGSATYAAAVSGASAEYMEDSDFIVIANSSRAAGYAARITKGKLNLRRIAHEAMKY